jgi:hypothetical protein
LLHQVADRLDSKDAEPAADSQEESGCNGKRKRAVVAVSAADDDEYAAVQAPTCSALARKTTKTVKRPPPAARERPSIVCVTYKNREYNGYVDGRCVFFRLKNGTASGWVSASGQLAALIREVVQESAKEEHRVTAEEHAEGGHGAAEQRGDHEAAWQPDRVPH